MIDIKFKFSIYYIYFDSVINLLLLLLKITLIRLRVAENKNEIAETISFLDVAETIT